MNDQYKKYLHLIISRVAIKWKSKNRYRNEDVGLNWEDWVKNSFILYDKFCRKSLQNQSNQNFKLISLIDKSIKDVGNILPNEATVHVSELSQISKEVITYVSSLEEKYDYILITRIDRDDVLKYNFVENLQKNVEDYLVNHQADKFYFDIGPNYVYSTKSNTTYYKDYYKKVTSPFISVLERNDNNFECVVYNYSHDFIDKKVKGNKYEDLQAIQVVHDHNILNQRYLSHKNINANKVDINLSEYGI